MPKLYYPASALVELPPETNSNPWEDSPLKSYTCSIRQQDNAQAPDQPFSLSKIFTRYILPHKSKNTLVLKYTGINLYVLWSSGSNLLW